MKDVNSKYGIRPEEEFGVVQEIWHRSDLLELCAMLEWNKLMADIKALPITPKETFTDKIKHGDVQITLYRNAKATTFEAGNKECPFHFTIEDCK